MKSDIIKIVQNLLKDPEVITALNNLENYDKGLLEIDTSELQSKLNIFYS